MTDGRATLNSLSAQIGSILVKMTNQTSQIPSISKRIDDLQETVKNISAKSTANESSIIALENRVGELEDEIAKHKVESTKKAILDELYSKRLNTLIFS